MSSADHAGQLTGELGPSGWRARNDLTRLIASAAPQGVRLVEAVRPRNILVHRSLDIDHGRLVGELHWIEATQEFTGAIERWIDQHSGT